MYGGFGGRGQMRIDEYKNRYYYMRILWYDMKWNFSILQLSVIPIFLNCL